MVKAIRYPAELEVETDEAKILRIHLVYGRHELTWDPSQGIQYLSWTGGGSFMSGKHVASEGRELPSLDDVAALRGAPGGDLDHVQMAIELIEKLAVHRALQRATTPPTPAYSEKGDGSFEWFILETDDRRLAYIRYALALVESFTSASPDAQRRVKVELGDQLRQAIASCNEGDMRQAFSAIQDIKWLSKETHGEFAALLSGFVTSNRS